MMGSDSMILQRWTWRRWFLLMGFITIMATGCAGGPSRSSDGTTGGQARMRPQPQIKTPTKTGHALLPMEKQLRSHVRQWRGTPHRMGGGSRRGIDCSGFVQRLYQDIFHRQIPRSTALQVKSGRPITKNKLSTGDLVFFKLPYKGRHVGIYLGQSEFAHASTSKGVTISSLEDDYWHRNYWTARRYMDAPN